MRRCAGCKITGPTIHYVARIISNAFNGLSVIEMGYEHKIHLLNPAAKSTTIGTCTTEATQKPQHYPFVLLSHNITRLFYFVITSRVPVNI